MVQELLKRIKHNILHIVFALSFLSLSGSLYAQSVLLPADIVIVSVNATDNSFDFIPLVDLEEGTTLWFSNGAWNSELLSITGGNEIGVTITSTIEAGTNIHINSIEDHRVDVDGRLEFTGEGDRIFAFQKDNGATRVIYGIGWGSTQIWDPKNEIGSAIPASISKENHTLIHLGDLNNYQYYLRNGASGTPRMLASFVSDPAKWRGKDKSSYRSMGTAFRILIPPVVLFDESISTTKESESILLNVAIYEHDGSRLTVDAVFNPTYSSADTNDTEKFHKHTFNFTGLIGDAVYAIEIPTTDDDSYESTENAFFELQNLSKGELGDFVTHAAFINDNEVPEVDINQVVYSGNPELDFIEIINKERIDVDLSGWKIQNRGELFEFPYGTFLPAFQSIRVQHPEASAATYKAKRWLRRNSGSVELRTNYNNRAASTGYRLLEREANRTDVENISSNQIQTSEMSRVEGAVELSASKKVEEKNSEPGWYVLDGSELTTEWDLGEVFMWDETISSYSALSEVTEYDPEITQLFKFLSEEELMEAVNADEDTLSIPEFESQDLESTVSFSITGTDVNENGIIDSNEGFNLLKNTSSKGIRVKDVLLGAEKAFQTNFLYPYIYTWEERAGWATSVALTEYEVIPPSTIFWVKTDSIISSSTFEVELLDSLTLEEQTEVFDEEIAFIRLQLSSETTSNSVQLRFTEDENTIIDIMSPEFVPELAVRESNPLFLGLGRNGTWNRMVGVNTFQENQKLVLPIRFESSESGIFSFSIREWEGIPSDWTIKLVDDQTGKEFILRPGWAFDFEQLSVESEEEETDLESAISKQEEEEYEARFRLELLPPGFEETESFIPEEISLHQNYPNPFNPKTIISFTLPESMPVKLSVFNVVGQPVAVLSEGTLSEGEHEFEWDATGLPSGMYIYQLEVGTKVMTRKMTLVK